MLRIYEPNHCILDRNGEPELKNSVLITDKACSQMARAIDSHYQVGSPVELFGSLCRMPSDPKVTSHVGWGSVCSSVCPLGPSLCPTFVSFSVFLAPPRSMWASPVKVNAEPAYGTNCPFMHGLNAKPVN